MTKSPQHQQPNSPTNTFVPTSGILVPEQTSSEQSVHEKNASEQTASVQNASESFEQPTPSISIIQATEPTKNDQSSSSNLAIQPVKPTRKNVPSPSTIFLDSTILSHVCESIFLELNSLIEARSNPIHEESYEKQWMRLKERVDFIFLELQRSYLDEQEIAQA